ncbi:MAG: hypothetical protein ACI4SY_00210 [Sutterella sp.]
MSCGIATDLSFDICSSEIESGELVHVLNGWHRSPWQMTLAMSRRVEDVPQIADFARWFAEREREDNPKRWRPMFDRLMRTFQKA